MEVVTRCSWSFFDDVSMQMAASAENYIGTLQDFLFIDEVTVRVVAMNEPVSFFNVAIGRGDKNS